MAVDRPKQTTIEDLPQDVLRIVAEQLNREDAAKFATTSKATHKAAESPTVYRQKLKMHFPAHFTKLAAETNINWKAEYIKAYNKQYNGIPLRVRKLFSIALEQDIESLKLATIKVDDLHYSDNSNKSLLVYFQKTGNQKILDIIFQKIYAICVQQGKKHFTKGLDRRKNNILLWAIFCNQPPKIIKWLIDEGCDIHQRNCYGSSIIYAAAAMGNLEIIKLILKKDPALINQLDNDGKTPAMFAASHGHADILQYLVDNGADLEHKCEHHRLYKYRNFTALLMAIECGHIEAAKKIIDLNIDIAKRLTGTGMSAIHLAAHRGQLDILKYMLEKNPELINQVDNYNNTPLFYAARNGKTEIVRYLITKKADLNIASNHSDFQGYTALQIAIEKAKISCAKLLIESDADLTIANDSLVKTQAIHLAVLHGDLTLVKQLIEKNPDLLNAVDRLNTTPLTYAASKGHDDIVDYLLECGANLEVKLNQHARFRDWSAADFAARNNHYHTTKAIIKKKISTNLTNNYNFTPPYSASDYKTTGLLQLMKYLEERPQKAEFKKYFKIGRHEFFSKPFTLFGKKYNIGKEEKINAANALRKVVLYGYDPSLLDEHKDALNNGELGAIYRKLKIINTTHNEGNLCYTIQQM